MKRLIRNLLYFACLAAVLARSSLASALRLSAAEALIPHLPALFSAAVCVLCTLLLIIRTQLLGSSCTGQDLLINLAFAALSTFLLIWSVFRSGSPDLLLIALLTQNIWDVCFLLFQGRSGRSQ